MLALASFSCSADDWSGEYNRDEAGLASTDFVHPGSLPADPVGDSQYTQENVQANRYGLDEAEIRYHDDLIDLAGKFQAEVELLDSQSFGGLWVEKEPEFRIVIAVTRSERARKDAKNLFGLDEGEYGELRDVLSIRQVDVSYADLVREQARCDQVAADDDVALNALDVDIRRNRVMVYARTSKDAEDFVAAGDRPSYVEVSTELPAPTVDTHSLEGGRDVGCTSGFTLMEPTFRTLRSSYSRIFDPLTDRIPRSARPANLTPYAECRSADP
ncbi:MAG: hypothetical protein V3V08_08105, partial [Nannocystaceae bacterium]